MSENSLETLEEEFDKLMEIYYDAYFDFWHDEYWNIKEQLLAEYLGLSENE